MSFTLLSLEDAKATLRTLTAQHTLLSVMRALTQLLQVPGGVSVLLKASPEGLRDISKEEIYKELHELRGRLPEGKKELDLDEMPPFLEAKTTFTIQ